MLWRDGTLMILLSDGFQAQEQYLANKASKLNKTECPESAVIGTAQTTTCLGVLQGLAMLKFKSSIIIAKAESLLLQACN